MKTFAFLLCILTFSITKASRTINNGFSVELIHRDSPKSPFFNPTQTPRQRLANAFRRSRTRAYRFNQEVSSLINEVQSEIISASGEYLMKIQLGTPPVDIIGIADTGSDLIWTQCMPCDHCFDQQTPLFDPKSSKTYHELPCSSDTCSALERTQCSSNKCDYAYSYGDQSYTNGNLAVETITLPSSTTNETNGSFKLDKAVIGCGHSNGGTFNDKTSGIVGLGRGQVSLISQLGHSISGKFSYCLIPYFTESDNTSSLNFGSKAIVSGRGALTTPLIEGRAGYSTFYLLTLEAISVGNVRLEFPGSAFGTDEGNIIIDSGTTLTILPSEFYQDLENLVDQNVGADRTSDPSGILSLCYSANKENDLKVPVITAHFTGADVKMDPSNTFIAVAEGVVCFAFAPSDNGAIFGNIAQMGYLVGYDIQKQTVSFKPTDCTKV